MTQLSPPTLQKVVHNYPDGTSKILVSSREVFCPDYDMEGGNITYGYSGPAVERIVPTKTLWTRKEKKRFRGFMQAYRNGDYVTMDLKYGVRTPEAMKQVINEEMKTDSRLIVDTRRAGIIHSSVEQQSNFAMQSAGAEDQKT